MMVHLDKEQSRQQRRRLLGDHVFVIFHDMLKEWHAAQLTSLTPVDAYLSARSFASTLISLPDAMEGIEDEIADLEEEAEGNDAMIVMMLSTAILQAYSSHSIGWDAAAVSRRIYERWCDHELFFSFFDYGTRKEQARWLEGKKTDLLTCEIRDVEEGGEGSAEIVNVFSYFINCSDKVDASTIKENLLLLNKFNIDNGHKYDAEINVLYEKLGIRSTHNITVGQGGINIMNAKNVGK